MRRSFYVAFALVLVAATTQARADMVTSNMTGTITYTGYATNVPFAVGDHISWTLQYDRSTPMSSSSTTSAGSWASYQMPGYVLTNIVDQTTGYHFPTLPPSGWNPGSGMDLLNNNPGGVGNYPLGSIFVHQSAGFFSGSPNYYGANLNLLTASSLPTLNLATFSFDKLPIEWSPNPLVDNPTGYTNFRYAYGDGKVQLGFLASVDSVPGAFMVPEPGTLTLFLLGAVGLTARGLRRRFVQVGYNEPEA